MRFFQSSLLAEVRGALRSSQGFAAIAATEVV